MRHLVHTRTRATGTVRSGEVDRHRQRGVAPADQVAGGGRVLAPHEVAGPRVLEHLVDCVLHFEGDRYRSHRILRAVKNRFGSTHEVGLFEMTGQGLREVTDPGNLFLEQYGAAEQGGGLPSGSVITAAMQGSRVLLVEVQALTGASAGPIGAILLLLSLLIGFAGVCVYTGAASKFMASIANYGSPGFAEFFADVTPAEELGELPLGSRPARRGGGGRDLASLRAIPWSFAWAQARINLPGWYGLGAGLAAGRAHVGGMQPLRELMGRWPFLRTAIDNAALSLVKADMLIARTYLELSDRADLATRIVREYEREGRELLAKIEAACNARNHAAFCDHVHALKGNAANVGAKTLIDVCHQAESGGLILFMRERDELLQQMRRVFADTLAALHGLLHPAASSSDGDPDHTIGNPE